jgi:DNA repair exonuclease SbcCD ATPase subunit
MRYPTLEVTDTLKDASDIEEVFSLVADLIDVIYDGEEVYHAKETKKEELLQFLNNLTTEQFAKIQKFFETMPKISTEVEYKCPICGKEHQKLLEGLQNFF